MFSCSRATPKQDCDAIPEEPTGHERDREPSHYNELNLSQRLHEGRYQSLRTDDDGMLVLEGRLPLEVGALLTGALETAAQQLHQRAAASSTRLGRLS